MGEYRGPRLAQILIAVLVLGVLAAMLLPALQRPRVDERRVMGCRRMLSQIAMGMATYLNEFGDSRYYPCPLGRGLKPDDYNGAEWLASLYWTRILPDPGAFICPSSTDTNHDGRDLGSQRAIAGRFGSQTVSYAGMHYKSLTDTAGRPKAGAIMHDFPPNEPMASDDTEGSINHGDVNNGGTMVLFFDGHKEFWTHEKIDLERGVGLKGGPLWRLRN